MFNDIPAFNSGPTTFKMYSITYTTGVGMRSTDGVSSAQASHKCSSAVNPSAPAVAPGVLSLITQEHHLRTTENAARLTLSMHKVW